MDLNFPVTRVTAFMVYALDFLKINGVSLAQIFQGMLVLFLFSETGLQFLKTVVSALFPGLHFQSDQAASMDAYIQKAEDDAWYEEHYPDFEPAIPETGTMSDHWEYS